MVGMCEAYISFVVMMGMVLVLLLLLMVVVVVVRVVRPGRGVVVMISWWVVRRARMGRA
jgi:hypothetical protein